MRRFWALIAVVFGVWAAAYAEPKLVVSEYVYDFGEVREGILVVHTFILRNEGDSTLQFTRQPSTSCGCTSAPLSKMTLEPGEEIPLEVRFETTGYGGRRPVKYVYIYFGDPENPQKVTLAIQGNVVPHEPFEDSAYNLRNRYRLVLDVRDPSAFQRGHLLGAINVPPEKVSEAIAWLPSTVIYVYDEDGRQGLAVAETLRKAGFWAVRAVSGGLAGWVKELGSYLLVGEMLTAEPQYSQVAVPPSKLAQEYMVILDFREKEAYLREHLVGAIPVGPTGLDEILPILLPAAARHPESQPFIYCVDEGEGRAQEAAQFLQSLGLARAYALVGGLPQWRVRYGSSFMVAEASG